MSKMGEGIPLVIGDTEHILTRTADKLHRIDRKYKNFATVAGHIQAGSAYDIQYVLAVALGHTTEQQFKAFRKLVFKECPNILDLSEVASDYVAYLYTGELPGAEDDAAASHDEAEGGEQAGEL